jgi:predicted PhzF superfamily epimerase YddE/YHI9
MLAPPFQVALCGHATLASAHYLFTSVLAEHDAVVEFATKSGILTSKKVPAPEGAGVSGEGRMFIEMDLPMIDLFDCDNTELQSIPKTLNGASVVSVHKSATAGDLVVNFPQTLSKFIASITLVLTTCLSHKSSIATAE